MLELNAFANTPDYEYDYLKEQINASAEHNASYIFNDIQLPRGCSPRRISLSFSCVNGTYYLDAAPHFTAPHSLGALYDLAIHSCEHFPDFEHMKAFLRSLSAERPPTVNPDFMFLEYLTKDHSHNFKFQFVKRGKQDWRIYIRSTIEYGSRDSSSSSAHWLSDSDGRYICWNTPIKSYDAARSVACCWSEVTAYYIAHGGSFTSIAHELGFF